MKKVTYIISEIDRAIMFEWIVEKLDRNRFQLSFVLMNPGPSYFEEYLKEKNIEVHRIRFARKRDRIRCFFSLRKILKKIRPDVVHTHFFDASIVGLFSAKLLSIPMRIYTRHYSNLHHVYFKKGIVFDRAMNKMATHVIAISGMVQTILQQWEKLPARKIVLIPHGINIADFTTVDEQRVNDFRKRYLVKDENFTVGVISRFTEWKGVQYIIPAFKNFVMKFPKSVLVLLNAHGDYEQEIKQMLKGLPPENYRLIRFERDIPAAYKTFDAFVHVPIDAYSEAFGLIYIEALASQVPSIFTLSGIAPDFIRHNENAIVVPFKDSQAIYKALVELKTDRNLCDKIMNQGFADIESKFPVSVTINKLEQLYQQ
jgi:glycosyltransferase involved in cell wall biosynthesis